MTPGAIATVLKALGIGLLLCIAGGLAFCALVQP
jgi:hypothetical protein